MAVSSRIPRGNLEYRYRLNCRCHCCAHSVLPFKREALSTHTPAVVKHTYPVGVQARSESSNLFLFTRPVCCPLPMWTPAQTASKVASRQQLPAPEQSTVALAL